MASRINIKKMYKQMSEDYRRLLAQHQEMRREYKALKKENEKIRKENEELRRLLTLHDNANTPPSRKMTKRRKKTDASKKGGDPSGKETPPRRRGAQPGHKGTTNKPTPTEFETHVPIRCPGCGDTSLVGESTEAIDITEIPQPVKATTTRHYLTTCRCSSCGMDGIDPRADLPKGGSYGRNVVGTVVHNFLDRLPGRLNAASMGRHGIGMSTGAIHNVLFRTGLSLGEPSLEVRDRIRRARLLHIDETSISLNGTKVWIWIFLNPETGDTYYLIRPSRGPGVVREVLGENWSGTIICDGWGAYKGYRHQRCWAHILREGDHLADRNEHCGAAREVADALLRIYRDGVGNKGPPDRRRFLRDALRKRVSRIIDRYADHPVLEKFMTKLANALPNLLRFVIDPSIPATNNSAERGLPKTIQNRRSIVLPALSVAILVMTSVGVRSTSAISLLPATFTGDSSNSTYGAMDAPPPSGSAAAPLPGRTWTVGSGVRPRPRPAAPPPEVWTRPTGALRRDHPRGWPPPPAVWTRPAGALTLDHPPGRPPPPPGCPPGCAGPSPTGSWRWPPRTR